MKTTKTTCDLCGSENTATIKLPQGIMRVDSYFAYEVKQAFLHPRAKEFDLCADCMAKHIVAPLVDKVYELLPNAQRRVEYFKFIVDPLWKNA